MEVEYSLASENACVTAAASSGYIQAGENVAIASLGHIQAGEGRAGYTEELNSLVGHNVVISLTLPSRPWVISRPVKDEPVIPRSFTA